MQRYASLKNSPERVRAKLQAALYFNRKRKRTQIELETTEMEFDGSPLTFDGDQMTFTQK